MDVQPQEFHEYLSSKINWQVDGGNKESAGHDMEAFGKDDSLGGQEIPKNKIRGKISC